MPAPAGESSELIVGPSRFLPWPLDVAARRAWDEAALWYRMRRHGLPVGVSQCAAAAIDLAQRPRLAVWGANVAGARFRIAANDPLIRHELVSALGASDASPAGHVNRALLRPTTRFDADVAAVEVPTLAARRFAAAGWLVLPRWVAMEVDLSRPERELWDARKRETVRRIEGAGLSLEIAHGRAAARDFHERFYAPTAQARHGPRAIVLRPGHVQAALRRGAILFVVRRGERLAGMLAAARPGRDRVVDALLSGVASGDYAGTRLAREAAYLFAVRWARDTCGASRLGLTAAAPFVHDGILRFKKRWGATALADLRQASCVAVRLSGATQALARAIAQQPPIALRWRGDRASLCALAVRTRGERAPALPATPGVDLDEIEITRHADLPDVLAAWAKAAARH